MSIQPFAAGSYVSDRNTASLVALKSRLQTLSTQLATGRTADTYGGLGAGRTTSLSARAIVSALDGYMSAITSGSTRVKLASASLTQLSTLTDTMRTGLKSGVQSSTALGIVNTVSTARASFDAAIDALNQNFNGQYLFAGRASDTQPVVSADLMFDGDPSKSQAGLKQLIAEQKAADLGPAGKPGWIDTTVSGSTVSLDQTGTAQTRANFGFTLLSVTSSNTAAISTPAGQQQQAAAGSVSFSLANAPLEGDHIRLAINNTDGSQRTLDLTVRANSDPTADPNTTGSMPVFANASDAGTWMNAKFGSAGVASAQSTATVGIATTFGADTASKAGFSVIGTPNAGDTITVKIGLHDGTTKLLQLQAVASAPTGSTSSFSLGATTSATAANIAGAIQNALGDAADTDLAASSTARASDDFFAGSQSPGLAPRRIGTDGSGNPAYVNVAGNNTVIWYMGDDSSADPRATASVQVGANRQIAVGAQANEAAIKATLAGLATLAVGGFADATGAQDTAKFAAAAKLAEVLLTPSDAQGGIPGMLSEFGVAAASMANAKTQAQATKNTLEDAIGGVETISTEEVAAKLLTLQTQLQASYQVTSTLSKLTLVNYMS